MARKKRSLNGNGGNGSFFERAGERLRTYFLAGILVTGPIAFTLWITWSIVDFIDRAVSKLVPSGWAPELYFPFNIPGVGLVVAAVVLTLIGWLAAGYFGRLLLRLSDRVMKRMPVISGIYNALKQVFDTVFANRTDTFREAVLVEWPRRGAWTVAFVTAKAEGPMLSTVAPDAIALYVPTTPNPTSGYIAYVPRSEVVPLDMSVEAAIKLVISCGIIMPPQKPEAQAEGSSDD